MEISNNLLLKTENYLNDDHHLSTAAAKKLLNAIQFSAATTCCDKEYLMMETTATTTTTKSNTTNMTNINNNNNTNMINNNNNNSPFDNSCNLDYCKLSESIVTKLNLNSILNKKYRTSSTSSNSSSGSSSNSSSNSSCSTNGGCPLIMITKVCDEMPQTPPPPPAPPLQQQQQYDDSINGSCKYPDLCCQNESLLNFCEEHLKETDEYKRANMRRALSVKSETPKNVKETREKKVVRFADALGLDLVSVKLILNPESPPKIPRKIIKCLRDSAKMQQQQSLNSQQPKRNNTNCLNSNTTMLYRYRIGYGVGGGPSGGGDEGFDDDEDYDDNREDDDYSDNDVYYNNDCYLNNDDYNNNCRKTSAKNDIDTFEVNNIKLKYKLCFEQPGILPDFYIRLNERKAILESVYIKSGWISGIVRVLNISFEKNVKLRYSIDNWLTSKDIDTTYVNNSCDGVTDRFSFNINIDTNQLSTLVKAKKDTNNNINNVYFKIEFAIVFQSIYWDNNCGKNYVIECVSANNPSSSKQNPTTTTTTTNNTTSSTSCGLNATSQFDGGLHEFSNKISAAFV